MPERNVLAGVEKELRQMMPIGPLMIEHRLIERMIALMDAEATSMQQTGRVDLPFVNTSIDFLRTYADRCHHGKEEGILFVELAKRPLSEVLKKTMDELVAEHVWARHKVGEMADAASRYAAGDDARRPLVASVMGELVQFYPAHIAKEDKHFFIPVMSYFSKEEQNQMLAAFWEFDSKLIHEKYQSVVQHLLQERGTPKPRG